MPPAAIKVNAAEEIKDFLQDWKTAWEKSAGEKGNIDAFMSFYSDTFAAGGLDKIKWRMEKTQKNRGKEWVRIELDNIDIAGPLENGRYEAAFSQAYRSSNYADESEQTLILTKEASGWKIIGIKARMSIPRPYSIYAGSYRSLPSARKEVEAFRKMELEAYWAPVDLGKKGLWYRIFVGHYGSVESAESIIKAKGLKDASVQRTRFASLIGMHTSEDDLAGQRRLLLKNGYSPYLVKDDQGRLKLYVGAYDTLENAEKLSAELNAKGISGRAVKR